MHLLTFHSLDSTNEEAKRQLQAGREDEFAIWARSQQAGRGRYGRQWESPEGNLYLSLVVYPHTSLAKAAELSFVAALAVGNALGEILADTRRIQYKWPNDVLLDGKKVAGILLESSAKAGSLLPDCVIIGVGINIAHFPSETRFPATGLVPPGTPVTAEEVRECLQIFLKHFTQWHKRWKEQGFLPLKTAWLTEAWGRGMPLRAETGSHIYQGVFETLSDKGELVLQEEDGTMRHVTSGEVFFGGSECS